MIKQYKRRKRSCNPMFGDIIPKREDSQNYKRNCTKCGKFYPKEEVRFVCGHWLCEQCDKTRKKVSDDE